jgi:hypothetical protein
MVSFHALLGVTIFLLSGWTVFLAGQSRPGGQVPAAGREAAGWIFLMGFAFILCYVSICIWGRPQFMVPPSMRSGHAAATVSGRPADSFLSSRTQGGSLDRAGSDAVQRPGETLYARFLANRVHDGRAFGGHVTVTSGRLIFEPVGASQANGSARCELPLAEVTGADVAPRGWSVRTGAWRRRLRVHTMAGDVELFVVWRPHKAADLVDRARQRA